MKIDLHTHSNASDGALAPIALVEKALDSGVRLFSITDHDTIAGYAELENLDSNQKNIEIVSGIEFSCRWAAYDIHVVGLDIDINSEALKHMISGQERRRKLRAERIAERLEKLGIKGSLLGVSELTSGGIPGRPHFAQYLLKEGYVKDFQHAFTQYLGQGKPAYVTTDWPNIESIIEVINDANGHAVLAHPMKYKMTMTKLIRLVEEFSVKGGRAIEWNTLQMDKHQCRRLEEKCKSLSLAISLGSDFHSDNNSWRPLGCEMSMPVGLSGVWEQFRIWPELKQVK